MKKFIKVLCFCLVLCGVINIDFLGYRDHAFADDSEKNIYAKVLSNCVMYKTKEMSESIDDILFIVPETYFVLILDVVDEKSCYLVQYGKYMGYVSPSSVERAKFTPIVKTLDNITVDIKSNAGTQVWSAPSAKSSIYTTIDAGVKNITYIASAFGEIPDGGQDNIWYYISYTPSGNSTSVYEGYIYSENTTNLSEIVMNTETNPDKISDTVLDDKLIYISSTVKTIVVGIIVVPIILFFAIILYKIIKKLKKTTNYNKNLNIDSSESIDDGKKKNNAGFVNKFKSLIRMKNNKSRCEIIELQDDELL